MSSSTGDSAFLHAARSLASPLSPGPESPGTPKRPTWPRSDSASARIPLWSRHASMSSVVSSSRAALRRRQSGGSGEDGAGGPAGPASWYTVLVRTGVATARGSWRIFRRLNALQQTAIVTVLLALNVLLVLALIYHDAIYNWLAPFAATVRASPFGWLVLWFVTFLSAFPPMMGYSTCVTLAGFIYGMKGWFIAATANVLGSTASFIVCRRYLANWSKRLAARDTRIEAFTLVIERDGLPLLCAIRWCPLPYALSNCGLSTIQSIQPLPFAIATASAAPKLLLHVFVGDRLAAIAHDTAGEGQMDPRAKAVNYIGIAAGILMGAATGWVIYRRTVARAKALEAEGPVLLDDEPEGSIRSNGRLRRERAKRNAAAGDDPDRAHLLEHPDGFSDESFADDDPVLREEGAWMAGAEDRDEIDFGTRGGGGAGAGAFYAEANGASLSRGSTRSSGGDSESNVGFAPSGGGGGRRW